MNIQNIINNFYYQMTINELVFLNQVEKAYNISYNTILYLDLISYKDNCTVSFLAQTLHISKSAVTMKINELIRQGLISKSQSQDDKRIFYLHLSEKTQEINEKYDMSFDKAINNIEENFSAQEIENFCSILQVLSNSFLNDI